MGLVQGLWEIEVDNDASCQFTAEMPASLSAILYRGFCWADSPGCASASVAGGSSPASGTNLQGSKSKGMSVQQVVLRHTVVHAFSMHSMHSPCEQVADAPNFGSRTSDV